MPQLANRGIAAVFAVALMLAGACGACGGGAVVPGRDAGGTDASPDATAAAPGGLDAAGGGDVAADPLAPPDGAADRPPRLPPPAAGATEPYLLSETGLYADAANHRVAAGLLEFQPTHELWSDGARKRRWLELPPGTTIDTTDMDHWAFPVGTRVWKEFSRDGVRLETRMIERIGPGPGDYWMGAFVWRPDGSDAVYPADGASDINGTDHDAPAAKACLSCHGGEPGRVLGFSALQLPAAAPVAGARGANLAELDAAGLLSAPPPAGSAPFAPPGSAEVARALGYLHANCGHCHDTRGLAYRDTDLLLRLSVADREVLATAAYRTTVGVKMQKTRVTAATFRVAPGDPAGSGLVGRMSSRAPMEQMPPIATEHVDAAGVEAVSAWIRGLPLP